ncbi:MAG TPA: GvpL/GvpF family gas vesicle protein [Streptosporangiaceae bacterium]|nr:GvpL/GvpF family gas vesicle protein [Streptosporangiaceae bacterium]
MATSTREDSRAEEGQGTGVYVYGIVPGDVELNPGVHGVGDPPGEIRLVRSGDLAALVSDVDTAKPLGTPEDLRAHQEILDATVADAPVLPSRFGAVLTSEEAVAEELLEANHDQFTAALEQLEGLAEYIVRGRYDEQAILEEVLSENSQAARLRERIRGADPDATRELRIQLGEIVNDAIQQKRQADTQRLMSAMKDYCADSVAREATSELDAAYVAFLVEADKADDLKRAVDDLGDSWDGRVELTVRGPIAPYDFVGNGG